MKKLVVVLASLAMVVGLGCSTNKEAIQKGYLSYGVVDGVVGGVWFLATKGSAGGEGFKWNEQLMKKNYPECFLVGDQSYAGPLMCVQGKVSEEGIWR